MINSLETDAFLNGFMRFISRSGRPERVWSENGTNFMGDLAELSRSVKQLDNDQIGNSLV